ncbi:uncharacterized protein LOC115450000 isoform X2 [Manduca sexta]
MIPGMCIITLYALFLIPGLIYGECPASMQATLPFMLEYAIWRGWHQAIVYTPHLEQDCKGSVTRLVKCLNLNGIAVSENSLSSPRIVTKLGIIIICPDLRRSTSEKFVKLIDKLQDLQMNTASYDWLLTARFDEDFKYINSILNATSIRFDQNIAVTYPSRNVKSFSLGRELCDGNFLYKRNYVPSGDPFSIQNRSRYCSYCGNGVKTFYDRFYYRTSERFKHLSNNRTYKHFGIVMPLYNSGLYYNYSRDFNMTDIMKFSVNRFKPLKKFVNENYEQQGGIYILQYFKVRSNSTLYVSLLGIWSQEESMSKVEIPYPVEARSFLGEELIVGRCNSSFDGTTSVDEDVPTSPALLDDVLYFLTMRLNTTPSLRYYNKLGFRTYEGSWTGLLGALIGNSVDVALEPVTAHSPRHQDMDFIFPVAETMCNIYIRHQETSTVRDIFLAPFSTKLVGCVVGIAVIASLTAVVISKVSSKVRKNVHSLGYVESLIWSTGILCQQGSVWSPLNPAASILLIVCLFFAMVTYNAYAAFITSVLSVRVASVDTVAAVLHSPNLKIGYIRNGADQMYLMSTKDTLLNAFYIRGYSNAENLVSSADEGLARAATQDYAFFAGQRAARSTLRSLSQARGRCAVRELPVHTTRAHLAFPLAKNSPYAKPLLVSLLHLRTGGSLARLEAALVPDMPYCATKAGFASARATDVRSAFILLGTGFVTALLLGFGEYCWKNKHQQKEFIKKYYEQFLQVIEA